MSSIEESLRDMFASRVQSLPPTRDLSTAAIRRGRVGWLRRSAVTSVAAAFGLLFTVGGVTAVQSWGEHGDGPTRHVVPAFPVNAPTPTPALEPSANGPDDAGGADNGIGLDIRAGDRLWTTDGRQLRLTGVGQVTQVVRVPGGWVYAGARAVRLLRTDGTSISLSGERDRWTLSADGTRIAFAIQDDLYLARLSASGIAVLATGTIAPESRPVLLLPASRVVLATDAGAHQLLDLGRPGTPTSIPDLTMVYGGTADELAGLTDPKRIGESCLATLAVAAPSAERRSGGCGLNLAMVAPAPRLAPGGAWLAVPGPERLRIINVDRTVRGRDTVHNCPVRPQVAPEWADPETVVTADDRSVVRCDTGGVQERVALPAGVPAGWELVPRRTALTPPDRPVR